MLPHHNQTTERNLEEIFLKLERNIVIILDQRIYCDKARKYDPRGIKKGEES